MATSPPAGVPMPLLRHVREFRRRATIAAASVLMAAIAAFAFSDAIIDLLSVPLPELADPPHAVEMLATFVPGGSAQLLTAMTYFDFYLKLLLAVGVVFLLPAFLVLLNVVGVVTGRTILRGWRIAIVVITVFAALATPAAHIVSMLLLAGILVLFFLGAAVISILFDRRAARRVAVEA